MSFHKEYIGYRKNDTADLLGYGMTITLRFLTSHCHVQ